MKKLLLFLLVLLSQYSFAQNTDAFLLNRNDSLIRNKPTLPARTADQFDLLINSKVSVLGLNASDFNVSGSSVSIDYTNGQASSGSTKGFLSSADWTAFNSKVSGSGSTGHLTFWSSSSAVTSDANLTWDNTNKALIIGASAIPAVDGDDANYFWVRSSEVPYSATGTSNVAIGHSVGLGSLGSLTTGFVNVAIGGDAAEHLETGNYNIALGDGALFALVSGDGNVAVGAGSLPDMDGSGGNVAVGDAAGINLASGHNSVAIGPLTGFLSTTDNGQLSIQNAIYGIGNVAPFGFPTTPATGVIGFYGLPADTESMSKGLFLASAATAPTDDPVGGTFIWSESGILSLRIPSGGSILRLTGNSVSSVKVAGGPTVFSIGGGDGIAASTAGKGLQLSGGNGFASGNTNGGSVYINAGAPEGSGVYGNVEIGNTSSVGPEDMEGGIFIGEAITAPTGAPTGGVFFYVEGGDAKMWFEGAGAPFTIGGGGGGTPGGSDTEVQFNDGGAFGGDAGLVYNKTTNTLTLEDLVLTNALPVTQGGTGASTAAAARTGLGVESRTLYINNNSSGLTSTTSETKVASFQIAAGTIGANDIIEIVLMCTKSGTAGNMTPRIYFNTSDAVGGIQVGVNSSLAANLSNFWIRRGACKNATNAQVWWNLSNANDDMASANAAKLSTTVDFSADTWLVISNQNGNSGDTSTIESVTLRIYRQ